MVEKENHPFRIVLIVVVVILLLVFVVLGLSGKGLFSEKMTEQEKDRADIVENFRSDTSEEETETPYTYEFTQEQQADVIDSFQSSDISESEGGSVSEESKSNIFNSFNN
jgi:Tfp pilus assembly protein PilO